MKVPHEGETVMRGEGLIERAVKRVIQVLTGWVNIRMHEPAKGTRQWHFFLYPFFQYSLVFLLSKEFLDVSFPTSQKHQL